ncbi:MAG: putative DNA binding domain-containing protein [Acidimicrobiaceae bacterium]|nr:putative DNA binding domain-containing protein [Acidimicrobiia bacterium]MCY4492321.1 putative DNA binding domain-containing protein [Acidimicrobiaceae bacterium]
MNQTNLLRMIADGENSRVEFKRDDVQPAKLAAVIAGLLNLEGGHVLLGIEDDGVVSGLSRETARAEEWIMQVARDHLEPSIIPNWEVIESDGRAMVGIIAVPPSAPDKPYKSKQGSHMVTKVRVGTTTRDATREEEQRLYQQSGGLRYGLKPVPGASTTDLDPRRLEDYFVRIRGDAETPSANSESWRRLLCNLELAIETGGETYATVDGMLLFGLNAGRFLPQCGIRAVCFPGNEPGYATRSDERIKGPLVALRSLDGELIETGVVERALDFVSRNSGVSATLEGGRRVEHHDFPETAVREIVVNALVHRDYSIAGTDVLLSVFDDRVEVQSPGSLPNTVSIEGMRAGVRYARNQVLMTIMRDYGYVEGLGMGIRRQVIPAMAQHNGTEPGFFEEESRFTVRLSK